MNGQDDEEEEEVVELKTPKKVCMCSKRIVKTNPKKSPMVYSTTMVSKCVRVLKWPNSVDGQTWGWDESEKN